MKAYIVHDSPLGTDYSGAGSSSLLDEKGVTEVWSRGILVWKGKITNEAYAAFREANDWYELNNSDAL